MNNIIFQSDDCLVANKLKGEAVEGAKDGIVNLPLELKRNLNLNFIEAVNRLDVPVTGCALFALNEKALEFLNAAFAGSFAAKAGSSAAKESNNLNIEKRYWAITEKPKDPLPESGEAVHWIETNSRTNKSFAYDKESKDRKKAALKYRITGEGTNYLFMEIELLSGRHHQIRAQLAAIGFHIKGDLKYGAKRSEKTGGIRLHARSLSFPNPRKKDERIKVTADPPEIDNLWQYFLEKTSHGGAEES